MILVWLNTKLEKHSMTPVLSTKCKTSEYSKRKAYLRQKSWLWGAKPFYSTLNHQYSEAKANEALAESKVAENSKVTGGTITEDEFNTDYGIL